MADLQLIKLKIRRGPDADRKQVILDSGELGYVTEKDSQRLFAGNGITLGGNSTAMKYYTGVISIGSNAFIRTQRGDLIYDTTRDNLFILTGAGVSDYLNIDAYQNISLKPDQVTMEYNEYGRLRVKTYSLSSVNFNSQAFDLNFGFTRDLPDGPFRVNVDNFSIKYTPQRQIFVDPSDISADLIPTVYPGPNLIWNDNGQVRVGPRPASIPFTFNISWNTNTVVVTSYFVGDPPSDNAFDRPRINTFRTDNTNIVYMSAGFQVLDLNTNTLSTPWGDRTNAASTVTIPVLPTLSAGVDVFTTTDNLPTLLVPPLNQWSVTPTGNPNELRYQYLVNFWNLSTIQTVRVEF